MSDPSRWYQTDLRCGDTSQVAWLDARLQEGQVVSLKGDDRKWLVVNQYPYPRTDVAQHRLNIWNVGGIESEIIR